MTKERDRDNDAGREAQPNAGDGRLGSEQLTHASGATGYVNSEGGPLLMVDLARAGAWRGVEGGDYDAFIQTIDEAEDWVGSLLPIGGSKGFLWSSSPGTTDIWCDELSDEVLLAKALIDDEEEIGRLAHAPWSVWTTHGIIDVASGWLLILWAPESGEDVEVGSPRHALQIDASVGGSGLIVRCQPGQYEVETDVIFSPNAQAERCRLRKIA
jgi:hypothetical protein